MNPLLNRGGEYKHRGVENITLREALLEFNDKYVFMRGYSQGTAESYEWAINNLIKYTGDILLHDLTLELLIEWRHHVQDKLSINGLNNCCYRIRKFIEYWKRHSSLNIDCEEFLIPKKETKLPNYLTKKQLQKLYEACRGARERLLVSILYSTGIRVSELCHIKVSDIQEDTLLVHGKGSKERQVYLDKQAMDNIGTYLRNREKNSLYLFDSTKGGHLHKSAVERIMTRISNRASIGKQVTPHMIRHSHATMLMSQGCGIRHIQKLLGHADISTTQIYTHVTDTNLREAYKQYHVTLT
jgi:site-specific recombinase XerD